MNIAEILKYCPKGTKLYSLVNGEVILNKVNTNDPYPIEVFTEYGSTARFTEDGLYLIDASNGKCVLFPSKDQRDWKKFRLPVKNGDIMMTTDKRAFIANGKIDNDGCPCAYCGINPLHNFTTGTTTNGWTVLFYIPASEEAKKELFDKMAEAGYKWNANTLELEKIESIFKEGNVIKDNKNNLYLIVDTNSHPKIGCVLNQNMKLTILNRITTLASIKFTLANKEEKNKLFSALVKEGYKYDKEQHKLVKQEFKPFDKVLVRDYSNQKWKVDMFSHYSQEEDNFLYQCVGNWFHYCIPYTEQTAHLVGTTDTQ